MVVQVIRRLLLTAGTHIEFLVNSFEFAVDKMVTERVFLLVLLLLVLIFIPLFFCTPGSYNLALIKQQIIKNSVPKLGASFLTRHRAGLGVKVS
jgi:hypothetical protein